MENLYNKLISVTLSVGLLLVSSTNQIEVSATNDVEQINNLVLFAQFDDLSTYNFMEKNTDSMVDMCNSTATQRSLKSYVDTISYGKASVDSYFPQMQDGVIVPYKLSQSKENYLNYELLVAEVLSNIKVSTDIDLDGNDDGVIDNIILVIDGKAQAMNDILWPKAFYLSGLEINGLSVGYVNIQNSYSMFENLISGGVGAICHEFLHSLGYPDLYHNDTRTGVPVGRWDIMASNSIFLQYPLAYQRANISNWLEPTQIIKDGSYSLKPVSEDNGNRLYILKTPLSDTELFAIEYRKQGSAYSEEMDTKIYGTGLVIYRINTEVAGNYKYDTDGVYVFRPNETTLNGGEGDIYLSAYGSENAPKEIGSLDFSDGVSQGALVYSNGTNSGIKISNISLQDDTATFDVQFSNTTDAKLWNTITDTSNFTDVSSVDMTILNEVPYMVTSNGSSATVSYLKDDTWTTLGNSIGSGQYGSVNNAKIVIANDTPYVMFNDYDFNIKLYGYNKSTDTWDLKYSSSELSQYTDITSNEDKIYISYTVGSFPYALNILEYNTIDDTYKTIGDTISENACNLSIECNNDKIWVAYRDLNDNSIPKISTYADNTWTTNTLSNESCSSISSAVYNDTFIVATTGSTCGLYQIKDDIITSLDMPSNIEGSIFDIVPIVQNNDIYIAINTQLPEDFIVYHYADGSWEKLGNSLANEVVRSYNMIYLKDSLYVPYISSAGNLNVKKYILKTTDTPVNPPVTEPTTTTTTTETTTEEPPVTDPEKPSTDTTGDINLDGTVNYLDILLLKKHILNVIPLDDTHVLKADINSDSSIDILDLISLKELILK